MFEVMDNNRDEGFDQGVEVGSKCIQEILFVVDFIIEVVDMVDFEIE